MHRAANMAIETRFRHESAPLPPHLNYVLLVTSFPAMPQMLANEERAVMIPGPNGPHAIGGRLVNASSSRHSFWIPAKALDIEGVVPNPMRNDTTPHVELKLKRPFTQGQTSVPVVVLEAKTKETVTPFFSENPFPQERKVTRTYTLWPDGRTAVSRHWNESGFNKRYKTVGEVLDMDVAMDFWNTTRLFVASQNEALVEGRRETETEAAQESTIVFEGIHPSNIYQRLLDVLGTPAFFADDLGKGDVALMNTFINSVHSPRTIALDPAFLKQMGLGSLFDTENPQLTLRAKRPFFRDKHTPSAPLIVLEGNSNFSHYDFRSREPKYALAKRFITLTQGGATNEYLRVSQKQVIDGKSITVVKKELGATYFPPEFWAKVIQAALMLPPSERQTTLDSSLSSS